MSEGEIGRWIYHSGTNSRRYPQVTTYAYGIFDKGDLESLGRQMEPGTGRDCSILNENEGNIKDANDKRKARTIKNKASPHKKDESLSEVLTLASKQEMNIDILKFLAVNGDPIQKLDSMNKLIALQSTLAEEAKKTTLKKKRYHTKILFYFLLFY